ncbi:MAG: hypothetical protein PHY12_12435 [Eubacteriales bacterium]|nr:hypothetical protein [Eubacteriales bacterium]
MELEELSIRIRVEAEEAEQRLEAIREGAARATSALGTLSGAAARQQSSLNQSARAGNDYARALQTIESRARKLESALNGKQALTEHLAALRKVIAAYENGQATQEQYARAVAELGRRFGQAGDGAQNASARVRELAQTLSGDVRAGADEAAGLVDQLAQAAAASIITGSVAIDAGPALSVLAALWERAQSVLALLNALGAASSGSTTARRSSGGSRRVSTPTVSAPSAREDSPYEQAIDAMEHLKAVGELNYEQELAYLQRIRAQVRMDAQERLELAEKIYDAQQRILEQNAASIDHLADGLTTALQNRYEQMLSRELETLDDSREGWKRWAEEAAGAILEQIDALDALTEAEDRQAADEQEQRSIARLRQELEYEQDAYNRAMLQKQLDEAEAARAARLKAQERADERAALEEELTGVESTLEQQLAALDKQEDAVRAAYDKRLEAAALAAEAEKLLATNAQEEILTLIKGYAPEYDSLGRTLGERLAAGFADSVGNITQWFDSLNGRIDSAQEALRQSLAADADAFYGSRTVTVQQTNNFNAPVETPGETARRVAQANEALAEEVLSGR